MLSTPLPRTATLALVVLVAMLGAVGCNDDPSPVGSDYLPETVTFSSHTVGASEVEFVSGSPALSNATSRGGTTILVGMAPDGTTAHGLLTVTDPIRATTPLFSAIMAIIFLGEEVTLPIVAATLLIIAGITLLSWRSDSMKLTGSAVYLWYPIAASALAGATQVVRKFGMAAVPHPFLAAAVTATSSFA